MKGKVSFANLTVGNVFTIDRQASKQVGNYQSYLRTYLAKF